MIGRFVSVRRLLIFADQVASSLSNFVLTFGAARALTPDDFGSVAVSFIAIVFAVALGRGGIIQPYIVLREHSKSEANDAGPQGPFSLVLLLYCLSVATIFGAAGILLQGHLGAAILASGVATPIIVLQDGFRLAELSDGHPLHSVVSDLVWLVTSSVLLFHITPSSGSSALLQWAAGAGLGAAYLGIIRRRSLLSMKWSKVHAYLRDRWRLGTSLAADVTIAQGGDLLAVSLLTLILPLHDIGAIRGASAIFGPLQMLFSAFGTTALIEQARESEPSRLLKRSRVLGLILALSALVWTGVAALIPSDIGAIALGDTWQLAEPLLIPTGIAVMCSGLGVGAAVGLRVLGAGRAAVRARLVGSGVAILGRTVGALLLGALGAVLGRGLGAFSLAGALDRQLSIEVRNALGTA